MTKIDQHIKNSVAYDYMTTIEQHMTKHRP